MFPDPPKFTQEQWERCERSHDFRPILFEWYKYTGVVTNLVASIQASPPAAKVIDPVQCGVLIGLLNRCSRLMLANVNLSHEGLFGEATALIDRSILESTVIVRWLCQASSDERFARYIADGLKTEHALKTEIARQVQSRGGDPLVIEERMLRAIDGFTSESGMSAAEVADAKKLPDSASMTTSLGLDRVVYVAGIKMTSLHVHGSWPSLLMHYVEKGEDGLFHPRDHDCATYAIQFAGISLLVLAAAMDFVEWLLVADEAQPLLALIKSIQDEIFAIGEIEKGSDFDFAGVC